MNHNKKYVFVYNLAREYLDGIVASNPRLNKKILNTHLNDNKKFNSMEDSFRCLVISVANRSMMPKVIGLEKNLARIKKLLFDYDYAKTLNVYKNDIGLFNAFKKEFSLKGINEKRGLWNGFSKGIISGARFLSYFKTKNEFDEFISGFSLNKYTKAALPMLLSKEINGFGFALACNFLMELGYKDYPKPDVHLTEIFTSIGLSEKNEYSVFKSIVEMAETVKEKPVVVDKVFWLIGSGRFYLTKGEKGKELFVGRNRDKFIEEVKAQLKDKL